MDRQFDTSTSRRIEEMLRERELEKIALHLEHRLPLVASHADDAVANAVVRILSLDEPPESERLGPYLYRAAYNDMVDQAKARNRLTLPGGSLYDDEETAAGFEDSVLGDMEFQRIRKHVAGWTNRNIRAVTLAAMEAAYQGVTLSVEELAADASAIRGEALSAASVSQWKTRGYEKLRAELAPNLEIPVPEETR